MTKLNNDFCSIFRILKGGKISLVVSALLGSVIVANAAPVGGVITSGNATISQSGNTTNINQTTQKVAINWQNFSISSNETVNFNQPNTNSITLNRVIGNEKSVIDGALNANGQVWILNSNGILFNSTAKVNTSGLVVTTAELSDKDFQDGNYNFKNSKSNSIVNLGTIEVSNNGYVVLASNEVRNSGTIKAIKGKVYLSGNSEYTINLNGNSIVNLIVTKGVLDALAENSGTIIANGGEVYLTTNAVNELLRGVVNNTGVIEANSLDDVTGKVEVYAHGGTANVSGEIKAEGGFVETSGNQVKINDDFEIKTKEWLIDPLNFTISNGEATQTTSGIGATTLSNALANAGVTIQTTNDSGSEDGDIFVNSALSWSSNYGLTLNAYRNIYINDSITATGESAKVSLLYGQGAITTSNTSNYYIKAPINLHSGQNFSTKLGSDGTVKNYTVITSLGSAGSTTGTDLQGINGNLSGNYVLGSNIDATSTSTWNSGAGFAPIIGSQITENCMDPGMCMYYDQIIPFSGNFDGLGHNISNMTINRPTTNDVGLFGQIGSGAIVKNISLAGGSFTGADDVGALAGYNYGTIINTSASSSVSGIRTNYSGGLNIGGLVGGSIVLIDKSYATGNVSGYYHVGGLVGVINGSITNSYATGNVTGTNGAIGGLLGWNGAGTVSNSYSTGTVIGPAVNTVGGLIGGQYNGTVTNSFWDTVTSGQTTSAGGTGKTTAQMQTLSTYTNAGWNITGSDGAYPTFSASGATVWNMILPVISVSYSLSDILSDYTYNGTSQLPITWSASNIFSSTYSSWVLGTDYKFVYDSGYVTGFTNAGTYDGISIHILKSGYAEASSGNANGSFVIAPKPIDISASKTYDGNPNFTSGFILDSNDIVNSDTVTVASGSATTSSANANTYTSFATNSLALSNNNYTLTGANVSATINQRPITLTADSVSKIYGNQEATLSTTVSSSQGLGLASTDSLTDVTGTLSREAGENVGSYDVALGTGNKANNYDITFTADNNAYIISQRPITLTATDLTKIYGESDPTLAYSITSGSKVGSDDLGVSLTRTTGENVNTTTGYVISNNGTLNSNYDVTFNNGKLLITNKNLTAQVSLKTSEITGVPLKLDGILSSELVSQGTRIVVLDASNNDVTQLALQGKIQPGKYSVKAINENTNYALTSNSVELTINPALDPITVVKTQVSGPVIPVTTVSPIVVNTPTSQKVEINNNLAVKLGVTDTGSVNLVSQTVIGQPNQVVTLSELKTLSQENSNTTEKKEVKLEDVKVSLNQNSIVQIVNGGVLLPAGVEQLVYVVENKKSKGTN